MGVWKTDDMAPVTKETQARVERVAEAFREEGASIDMEARPNIDVSHSHVCMGGCCSQLCPPECRKNNTID